MSHQAHYGKWLQGVISSWVMYVVCDSIVMEFADDGDVF